MKGADWEANELKGSLPQLVRNVVGWSHCWLHCLLVRLGGGMEMLDLETQVNNTKTHVARTPGTRIPPKSFKIQHPMSQTQKPGALR